MYSAAGGWLWREDDRMYKEESQAGSCVTSLIPTYGGNNRDFIRRLFIPATLGPWSGQHSHLTEQETEAYMVMKSLGRGARKTRPVPPCRGPSATHSNAEL